MTKKHIKKYTSLIIRNMHMKITRYYLTSIRMTILRDRFLQIVGEGVDFLGDSVVKTLPANAIDVGSITRWVRFPGEGNGNPLQYSCLGNPMDRGA